jgi:hypothetical protein
MGITGTMAVIRMSRWPGALVATTSYNWIWFYNGYHAEHHFRPKVHWTRMQAFREQIVEQQHAAGVRVIKPPHALGFLDPNLPPRAQSGFMSGKPRSA